MSVCLSDHVISCLSVCLSIHLSACVFLCCSLCLLLFFLFPLFFYYSTSIKVNLQSLLAPYDPLHWKNKNKKKDSINIIYLSIMQNACNIRPTTLTIFCIYNTTIFPLLMASFSLIAFCSKMYWHCNKKLLHGHSWGWECKGPLFLH